MSLVDPTLAHRSAPSRRRPSRSDRANIVELHESIATLLASRGDYQSAYEHLRSAVDLMNDLPPEEPQIPEQLRLEVAQLRREHAEAREQSLRDSLTAGYNRRYLDERLLAMVAEQGERTGGVAVAIADLDWFKGVNDTFGHHVGDRVLQVIVRLLEQDLPEQAFCARYGGEEFVLVLPGVDLADAVTVAEATRARIEQHDWSTLGADLGITVSIGLHHQPAGARMDTDRQLINADQLLYAAKQSGRNTVAYADGELIRLVGPARRRTETTARSFGH